MKKILTIVLSIILLFTSTCTFHVTSVYAEDENSDTQQEVLQIPEDADEKQDEETVADGLGYDDESDSEESDLELKQDDASIHEEQLIVDELSFSSSKSGSTSTDGYAYAVLNSDGDLIFFRSTQTYTNDTDGTFEDILGYEYTGKVFAGFEDSEEVPWNESMNDIIKVYVASGQIIQPISMKIWFFSSSTLTSFDSKGFDTSNVTNMYAMFAQSYNLKNVDLNSFDTSSVTDMSYMFLNCQSLTSLDLSNFVTTNVTNMSSMFLGCTSLTTLDLSSFDTANVTDMTDMFAFCDVSLIKLGTGFTNWINDAKLPEGSYRNETLNLTETEAELYDNYPSNASAWSGWWSRDSIAYAILTSDGDLVFTRSTNIYENNTSDTVVDIDGNSYTGTVYTGFEGAIYTQLWKDKRADIKKVYAVNKIRPLTMFTWFSNCVNLSSFDATNFDTSQVTEMTSMFMYASKIESLDLSSFNTSKVKDMRMVFMGMTKLEDLNIKNFNTSNVIDMYELFGGCSSLKKLDLSHFDTSKVTRMSHMFKNCTSLATVDLSSFDTSRVTDMAEMFDGCSLLASVKLGPKWSNWVSDAKLPQGNWENEALSLVKTETELYEDYPENRNAWNGLWNRESDAYAVLKDDGDLVFVRSVVEYENASSGTLINIDGDSYTGIIFPGVENLVVKDSDELPWAEYIPNVKRIYAVNVIKPTSTAYWFAAHENLTSFNSENFDLSKTTSMKLMFNYCLNLTDLDLSHFDTSNVVDISMMFSNCQSLVSLDLSNFNTSKVTNMRYMFYKCASLTSLDLSGFDTANITKMDHLFNYSAVSSIKLGPGFTKWIDGAELPSGDWKNEELSLTKTETQLYEQYPENSEAWSGWWKKQSSAYAVLMSNGDLVFARSKQLFENGVPGTLSSISGGSYSGIIFSNIESTDGYYYNTPWRAYEKNIKKVYAVDPIKPLDTSCWFDSCTYLTSFNKANFDLSRVEDISSMFSHCSILEELDLSGLDTSNANRWGNMFSYCKNLVTLDLGGLDTSKAYTYEHMFIRCEKLKNLNISSFNSSNVNTMRGMFNECKSLTNLDLSHFDTSKVTRMEAMFEGCTNLKTLDISSFDTSKVDDGQMKKMFDGLNSLSSIKLGPKFTVWKDKAYLPADLWYNEDSKIFKDKLDLYEEYPFNAAEYSGTWKKFSISQYGEILLEDIISNNLFEPNDIPRCLWVSGIKDVEYTGKAITQSFRVYDYKNRLVDKTDYTVTYKNNTKAGTATITITGKGKFQGTLVKQFKINPKTMNATNTVITLNKDVFAYNGKVQTPKVTVTVDGVKLAENRDYEIVSDGKTGLSGHDISYQVAIKGKGNYRNYLDNNLYSPWYLIASKPLISSLTITGFKSSMPYISYGCWQDDLKIVDKKQSKTLVKDVDYMLIYSDNKAIGTATLKIQAIGEYAGYIEKTYKITGTSISSAKIEGLKASYDYDYGYDIEPSFTLTYKGTTLTRYVDYDVKYENNSKVGTASIIITGKGGYTGTLKKTFKIVGQAFNAKTIEVINFEPSKEYTGSSIEQYAILKYSGTTLTRGYNYEATYKNNINAGTATVTYTGKGKYTGSFSKTFKIDKAEITSVTLDQVDYRYTKGGVTPLPVVRSNGMLLQLNKDYSISYTNNNIINDNSNPKKITSVKVVAKGNYKGTVTKDFRIIESDGLNITMQVADKVYSNKAQAMSTTVSLIDSNGNKLSAGTDYDKNIVYTYAENCRVYDSLTNTEIDRYMNNPVLKTDIVKVGTKIKATATLKGNYGSGTISEQFNIIEADLSKATVTIAPQYYSGFAILLYESDIKVVLNKKELKLNTDYVIDSYSDNIQVGNGTVIIRGIGNYGGNKSVKFKIAQRSLGITVKFYGYGSTSGSMSDQRVFETTYLTACAFKKSGYTFDGWSTEPGGIKKYDNKANIYNDYKPGDIVRLYAVWK